MNASSRLRSNKMGTGITFFIRHYPIFATILSAIFLGGILPIIGNSWAQERGLVLPEPTDVAPPANVTNSSTIIGDDINTTRSVNAVNKTTDSSSSVVNDTSEPQVPQAEPNVTETQPSTDNQSQSEPSSNASAKVADSEQGTNDSSVVR
jgi:hypothetical protein